jgi:hypothetical protein
VFQICKDKQGTHPIQEVVENTFSTEEEDYLFDELKNYIVELANVLIILF